MRASRPDCRQRRTGARFVVDRLEPRLLLAAQLVKDINTDLVPVSSVGEFVDVNGTAFFFVAQYSGGYQIWKSDGTAGGTAMVKALGPLATYDAPRNFLSLGGKLFFIAGDRTTNLLDLWVSDGTPQGTIPLHQVPRLSSPFSSSAPRVAIADGTRVFFVGGSNTPTGISAQLWATDGSAQGTVMLTASNPLGTFLDLNGAGAGGVFYFSAADPATQKTALWVSDGTAAGTSVVEDLAPLGWPMRNFATVGNTVYFTSGSLTGGSNSGQLMTSDGTAAGTVSVATINYEVDDPDPIPMVPFNGSLVLALPSFTDASWHLWETNGAGKGVTQLSTASLGVAYYGHLQAATYPGLHTANGKLFFFASDAAHGMEPWVSDGTAAGTTLVDDVNPGPADSAPGVYTAGLSNAMSMTVLGNGVYFEANDGTHGWQLWRTDGTASGTVALPHVTRSDVAVGLPTAGELIYLFPLVAPNGTVLQATDGTGAPPETLGTISGPATGDSQFYGAGAAALPDGTLVFFADDFAHGSELWRTDGTATGTVPIDDIVPGAAGSGPTNITSIGGRVYFENNSTQSLWTTDGTAAGTVPLTSGVRFVSKSLTDVNGTAYFFALGANNDNELWKSNGTPETTAIVAVIDPAGNTPMTASVEFQGMLYFTAATGAQLWRSDGTAAGTVRVFSGLGDHSYSGLVAAGRHLFLAESLGSPGNLLPPELFESDGTSGGTVPVPGAPSPVRGLAAVGEAAYFIVDAAAGLQVYRTDGSAAGTRAVTDPSVVSGPADLTNFNGTLLFTGGGQLWRTDGTPGGLVSLSPASASVRSTDMIRVFDNRTYFTATEGLTFELWTSDGTPAGTQLLAGGFGSAAPSDLAVAGGRLYFQASTAPYGRELWESPLPEVSIVDRVFNDANHNAADDPGEAGLTGAIVYLDVNGNGALDSGDLATTADAAGAYAFLGLAPGSYVVRQAVPSGYRQTTLPASASVSVAVDQVATGPTFGDVQISTAPMDFSYLLTLAQHYGQDGTFASGDVNGDGTVNFADLLLLAQNYGHALPTTAAAAAPAAASSDWLLPGVSGKRNRRRI